MTQSAQVLVYKIMIKHLLITQWYKTKSELRNNELQTAFLSNIDLKFDEIIVFIEGASAPIVKDNLTYCEISESITYKTLVDLVNDERYRDVVITLTNTDIYLDRDYLAKVSTIEKHELFAISRYENSVLTPSPQLCQDTWCIRGQSLLQSILDQAHIPLGRLGCESRFAEVFHSAGFKVSNPCLSIYNHHIQSTPSRHNEQLRMYGTYCVVPPTSLEGRLKVSTQLASFINRSH
jgi:hypothetical protein